MIIFKTYFQAKLYLKWINFWIPIKLKWKGQHLLKNDSFVSHNFLDSKGWGVFKQFYTQEQLDDLKNMKPFDPEIELNYVTNEDRKQKLDWILDDIPIPQDPLAEEISKNIINNMENFRYGKSES